MLLLAFLLVCFFLVFALKLLLLCQVVAFALRNLLVDSGHERSHLCTHLQSLLLALAGRCRKGDVDTFNLVQMLVYLVHVLVSVVSLVKVDLLDANQGGLLLGSFSFSLELHLHLKGKQTRLLAPQVPFEVLKVGQTL